MLVIVMWLVVFQEAQEQLTAPPKYEVYLRSVSDIPVASASAEGALEGIGATAYSVRDVQSGVILLERNGRVPLYPASTTKLVTALVAKDHYALDHVLVVPQMPPEYGFRQQLTAGKSFTVADLLQALLIASNNEAGFTLAHHYPGGEEAFVADMNQKAQQLSLKETVFVNPVGFDDPNMVSTANDLSLLGRVIMEDDMLRNIVGKQFSQITSQEGAVVPLYTTNQLLANPAVTGIKTGTTEGALQVLITYVTFAERPVTIVLLNSTDRYRDTRLLMDWVSQTVTWKNPQELSF